MGWNRQQQQGSPNDHCPGPKAWIEYYIQYKQATSILRLAFFSMDERQPSQENSRLEYHLVYRNRIWPLGEGYAAGAKRWVSRAGQAKACRAS
jgi:hypothetical protein